MGHSQSKFHIVVFNICKGTYNCVDLVGILNDQFSLQYSFEIQTITKLNGSNVIQHDTQDHNCYGNSPSNKAVFDEGLFDVRSAFPGVFHYEIKLYQKIIKIAT